MEVGPAHPREPSAAPLLSSWTNYRHRTPVRAKPIARIARETTVRTLKTSLFALRQVDPETGCRSAGTIRRRRGRFAVVVLPRRQPRRNRDCGATASLLVRVADRDHSISEYARV